MRGLLLLVLGALRGLLACRIMGASTGECQTPSVFLQYMPFCGPLLQYTACIPEAQTIWYNHSVKSKDLFLSQMYQKLVKQREYFEQDVDLNNAKRDEWGNTGEIVPRFTENRDCQDAFRNYMCWLNFPRCDDAGVSLVMCRSVCENYFKACMQAKDLWRCGDPAYVNGYEPEISTYANNLGELQYYRFPFPGSPFRSNVFTSDGTQALPVCTPSLLNGSPSIYDVLRRLHLAVLATWLVVFLR